MKLVKHLNPRLLSYQKEAVILAYKLIKCNRTHSCYNASEMGTGKTIISIEVLNLLIKLHKFKRTLILSPACVEYNWKSELEEWLCKKLSICVLDSGKKYTKENLQSDICITSYGMVRSKDMHYARLLAAQRFDNLILDESHNLKNGRALQTRAAFFLWDCVKTRQALSGTPFLSNIVDGYTLFHRMSPQHFPDFPSFVERYSYKTVTPWAIKYFGVKRPKELRKIIRKHFYFRYTLEDGEEELPPVIWTRIHLPERYSVEEDIKKQVKNYEEELSRMLYNLDHTAEVPLSPALAEHRRLQAEKAFKPILEFSVNILEQGKPLCIFGWHKSVLRMYYEKLKKYNPGIIVGDTPLKLRDVYVKEFQSGHRKLLIINYIAGGFGLTLTAGNTAVAAELDWNPTTLAQAAGRFRRIGQKKIVNFYYFETIKSIDRRVIQVVQSKASTFNKVM
jgi:SNF2 family DNA or RNA helicase